MAPEKVAFYDFDGTLVSSNIVTRYAWYAKNHPSSLEAVWRYGKVLLGVPLWLGLDAYSRRKFNEVFYRQYKGMAEEWLRSQAYGMFSQEIEPKVFPHAQERIDSDKREGHRAVMVSGGLDFAVQPAVEYFGFEDVIANRLVFEGGAAIGEVAAPLLAEAEKVEAMRRYCTDHGFEISAARGYSDSASDIPMLEAVGEPTACNPDSKLKNVATERGWPVLNFR